MRPPPTPPTKITVILAQVFISCMMAFLMTGTFTALPSGFAPGWVAQWMLRFATAWPIAFVLSMLVGPTAFWMARHVQRLASTARY
ncbi:MAG: DUF2798 domain-containing protein [Rhodobacteraceae bacterium]|jgi:hypothetical protein|uniref:DUF2798 domain-containing protein n=1 Tax=Salipiger TaxID=263377 RepID=UPI00030EE2E3|nr:MULTISPECIES: DUF2798 domain-containing protein [Salipiger]MAB04922.1 DUF2798 domain-containing protein [Paracoccaceae bacterium]SFD47451.1 Protein of unknown function [Salipiger profundus]